MCLKNHTLFFCLIAAALIAASSFSMGADPNVPSPTDPNGTDAAMMENVNPENVRVTLNFRDALVTDVLDYLSEAAGLVVVADAYPQGRINLISKQPLTVDEVVVLLTTVLKESGYAAIRTNRTLKLVSIGQAKYLNIPVTSGNDPDQIPEGDDIVTHIIPIRYADAIKLRDDISLLVSEDAVISSNEASNSLIITDTTANIKRLVKIVQAVDTQMSMVASVRVFLLEYADAENTADLINNVFEQRTESTNQQNPFMRMMQRGGPFGRRDRRGDDEQEQTTGVAANIPVIADADERTNAVVVSGPSDILPIIEQVVKELDSNPSEERSLFVYKLKYAQAENIKERLNSLFQELENINEQNLRDAGGTARRTAQSTTGDVSDEAYIEADEDTNTLIIMTSSKNYERIKKIIDELDVPIPQVLIKVLLAELTTSSGSDIGVEWEVESVNSEGDTVTNLFRYSPPPTEGFVSHIIQGDLDLTLRALEEVGNLNVLSRPYIMTSNNQTATINVGQRFPFITDSQITDTGNTINTVDYENIGIILEVTPSINIDGLVIMDVNPEITTALADTVKVSETVDATIFATRSAQCRVAVPNGQTVVIGGLMADNETENAEKIPLLGDLPLLGGLFKRTVTDNEKTELLIFLTPQVAENIEDLKNISDHERSMSKFLNEMEGTSLQEHVENMESVYQENPKD